MVTLLSLALLLASVDASQVVGGERSASDAWPSAASVFFGNSPGCSGVLIAPTLALTAGHCNSHQLNRIYVGGNDLRDLSQGELITVAERIEYPDSQSTYDVTLLVLSEPAETPPITVAHGCLQAEIVNGAEAQVVGFGATDTWGQQGSQVLMEATIPVTDADCSGQGRGCNHQVSPGGELVAGGDGVDSCSGDSGGPLYLWSTWGEPFLVGLTSRAAAPASVPCGDGGIYVRVDALVSWIESNSGLTLPEPDCDTLPNSPPEPSAEDLELYEGEQASTQVHANDPDSDQHSYALTETPEHGLVEIDDAGLLTYTAPTGWTGAESIEVVVSDGRDSAALTIEATVLSLPDPVDTGDTALIFSDNPGLTAGGCSCASTERGHAPFWLLWIAAAGIRRRRFSPPQP